MTNTPEAPILRGTLVVCPICEKTGLLSSINVLRATVQHTKHNEGRPEYAATSKACMVFGEDKVKKIVPAPQAAPPVAGPTGNVYILSEEEIVAEGLDGAAVPRSAGGAGE
jgi:hypothetical protein